MNGDLIEQFLDTDSLNAMELLLKTQDINEASSAGIKVSAAFAGSGDDFKNIAESSEREEKLRTSFHKNLLLLIQKTWVEKSDEELKAQVLYHLEEFNRLMSSKSYVAAYRPFFEIVDDVVYLMFGTQTKTKDFADYALRIDPEFGIFWWYMKKLPHDADWSQEKTRIAILLGMYFLANY